MPSRSASSVMLATVWRASGTTPMLEPSCRAEGFPPPRRAVERAGCGERGWSERGIGQISGCRGKGSDTISEANLPHNPCPTPGALMSAASMLDPRNALLTVLAIVALLYLTLVVRATLRGTK